jgi:hypothetical protein
VPQTLRMAYACVVVWSHSSVLCLVVFETLYLFVEQCLPLRGRCLILHAALQYVLSTACTGTHDTSATRCCVCVANTSSDCCKVRHLDVLLDVICWKDMTAAVPHPVG